MGRMYVETYMRFGELFKVNSEEAIDTLDRTFESKLEALHKFYDVSRVYSHFSITAKPPCS